ncbi:MAG: hypothetical protein Q8O30_11890 [Candidatus Omnitrophota bacterium]|nr:hypothetical protein [Candidatus Omnitrophota bacterium]
MATHIKTIVHDFLKNKKQEINHKERIRKIIETNIDKKLKKNIYLKGVYKNKLILGSQGSSFSYVFNLKKDKLLKAVQEEFPEIEDMKITIG